MFLLGIAAFMDSLFNYGMIFRQINSVLFMLISLALLIRTTTKMKKRRIEGYEKTIDKLEIQLRAQQASQEKVPSDY